MRGTQTLDDFKIKTGCTSKAKQTTINLGSRISVLCVATCYEGWVERGGRVTMVYGNQGHGCEGQMWPTIGSSACLHCQTCGFSCNVSFISLPTLFYPIGVRILVRISNVSSAKCAIIIHDP